uniref:Uncharacterized protein n=1 Tax=Anguilla anguilla TaxID=7936 RepID=A0A0E9VGK9_ANGAN
MGYYIEHLKKKGHNLNLSKVY